LELNKMKRAESRKKSDFEVSSGGVMGGGYNVGG